MTWSDPKLRAHVSARSVLNPEAEGNSRSKTSIPRSTELTSGVSVQLAELTPWPPESARAR